MIKKSNYYWKTWRRNHKNDLVYINWETTTDDDDEKGYDMMGERAKEEKEGMIW